MKQNEKPKQGILRLLEISGEKNTSFAVSVLLSILGTLCQLVPFLSIYQVMAELLRHAATGAILHTEFMIRWALYGLAGLIVGYVLAYAGGMMAHTFAYRVICGVRLKVAEHIGKLPMGYVTNNSIGKMKQVLDADVEQIETFLAHQLPDFVSTVVMLLAMFIIMFSQNVWLALACLIPIVVGFVCQFAVMIKILKSGGLKENFDALEKISSSSIQYVQGMPSIKIFGQTVKSFRKFYEDIVSYRDFTTKMTEVIRPGYVLFRMFVLSVATFIVPVGLLLFLQNPGDVAFVVTFLFFLIVGPGAATPTLKLRSFSESMNVITEGVKRVDEVLNEKPLPEPAHKGSLSGREGGLGRSKAQAGYDISFHNVSFSYEAEGRKILDNVSIARAILKNAPILILDEASAYADAENEHEMQIALQSLIKNKTVIMIAHRLTTICNANQILVVDSGQIKEHGTHDELLKKHGLYAAMWDAGVNSATWTIRTGKEAVTE